MATQHSYKNHREVVCGGLGEEAEAESVRKELNELETGSIGRKRERTRGTLAYSIRCSRIQSVYLEKLRYPEPGGELLNDVYVLFEYLSTKTDHQQYQQ